MLTKAFVVLVTVLAILLVALTVSSVAQYENLRDEMRGVETRLSQAENTARLRQSQLDAAVASHSEEVAQWRARENELTNRNSTLASQLAEAREQAAAARSDLERWEASLERLSAAQSQNSALLDALNEELDRRREQAVQMQTRLVESVGRIAELSTENESLVRSVRRNREQMQAMMDRSREMEERLAQAPPELREFLRDPERAERGPTPTSDISGQIVEIARQGQDIFVQVNVGSSDGVAEQMEFMVYRGDRYLARLVIDSVEADVAVGHLTLIQDEIQSGDAIFAGRL